MDKNAVVKTKRFFIKELIYKVITNYLSTLNGIDAEVQQYNYLYVIHRILFHKMMNYDDNNGCPMNIEYLGKLFGKSNQETSTIIRNLVKLGIIYKSKSAVIKKSSTCYKLNCAYDEETTLILNVNEYDAKFIKKLNNEHHDDNDNIKSTVDTIDDKFLNILKLYISINDKGLSYLNEKYKLLYKIESIIKEKCIVPLDGGLPQKNEILISKTELLELQNKPGGYGVEQRDIPLFLIFIKEFYCTRPLDKHGKKSRVYNNITNLPREQRQFINFCGNSMLMTDISNSQILLSIPKIENFYKIQSGVGAKNMPDDMIKFRQWCEAGEFYENFAKLLGAVNLDKEARILLKVFIFRDLWFGKIHRFLFNRIKPTFRKTFPNVFRIIKNLKIEDYKDFSIELQRFESEIMIDKVAKKMLRKSLVLTLHDAIICSTEADLELAEKNIISALSKYNLKPHFKREEIVKAAANEVFESDLGPKIEKKLNGNRGGFKPNKEIKPIGKKVFIYNENLIKKYR